MLLPHPQDLRRSFCTVNSHIDVCPRQARGDGAGSRDALTARATAAGTQPLKEGRQGRGQARSLTSV